MPVNRVVTSSVKDGNSGVGRRWFLSQGVTISIITTEETRSSLRFAKATSGFLLTLCWDSAVLNCAVSLECRVVRSICIVEATNKCRLTFAVYAQVIISMSRCIIMNANSMSHRELVILFNHLCGVNSSWLAFNTIHFHISVHFFLVLHALEKYKLYLSNRRRMRFSQS